MLIVFIVKIKKIAFTLFSKPIVRTKGRKHQGTLIGSFSLAKTGNYGKRSKQKICSTDFSGNGLYNVIDGEIA